MKLLTSQRLKLLEIATLKGFSNKDFIFKLENEGTFSKNTNIIFNPNENYYLQFWESLIHNIISFKYSPGSNELEYTFSYPEFTTLNFDLIKSAFNDWTDYLKIEVESDNIWNSIQKNSDNIFDKDFYNSDEKFSENELILNQKRMTLFQDELMKIPLLVEQQNFVQNEIKALSLKSNLMSRKDWYLLLIGTFVTISTTLGLSHEHGQMILKAFKLFFSSAILTP